MNELTSEAPQVSPVRVGLLAGGSALEVCGGVVGVVFVLVGLVGRSPITMAALAAIAVGGAMFVHSCAILSRWREVVRHLDRNRYSVGAVFDAVGTEAFGGAACAILGCIVIAGVSPPIILGAGAIALSSAVLFGGAAQPQLVEITIHPETSVQHLAHRTVEAADGVLVLAGIGAFTLGALSIIGIGDPVRFSLIAYLLIGLAILIAGGALTARFASYRSTHHHDLSHS